MKKSSISALVLLAAAMCACDRSTTPSDKSINVGVLEVGAAQSAYSRNYVGTVSASKHHLLLSPHSGTVTALNVHVGQKVKEDAVVAVIDAPNVNSLDKANQATLRQAQDGYARAKKVYEGGGMSEIAWMDVQTKLAQAESAAEISRRSVEDCTIKAPFSGTVSEVNVTLGEEVSIGKLMAKVIDESHLEVSIGIPENEYSSVREGSEAEVVVPALSNLKIKAFVSDLGVNSTALSHSYIATLSLRDYPSSLKAGMACKAYLKSNMQERVIVPAQVVKVDDQGRYVWLVDENNTVRKRRVAVGGFVDRGVEIVSGLGSGERIIVSGSNKVSSGMKVSPQAAEK